MNLIIGAIGTNLTLGLISGIAGTTNGVYTMISNIAKSTANGANEIKQIIKETDLEVKVKTVQFLLCEIEVNNGSSHTLQYCVKSIKDAIKDINDELEKIYYRMQYNDNLWVGSRVRSYKFHNCKARLQAKLCNLESRVNSLIQILGVENKMVKNDTLVEEFVGCLKLDPQESIAQNKSMSLVRADLHKKLEFINK